MIVDNQGGYLFTDEVVEFLLSEFENLTYNQIIEEMYEGKFKLNQHREVDETRNIKMTNGIVLPKVYYNFNSITYNGVQLNFTCQLATLFLDLNGYHNELERQKGLYGVKSK